MTTWEELQLGAMYFPIISGPAEGCTGLGLLLLFIWYVTPEYLCRTMLFHNELRFVLLWGLMIGAILTSLYNFVNVLRKTTKKGQAISEIYPFLFILMVIYITTYISPTGLAYSCTRELMLCLGFVFAREIL